jgi:hypothetical protein
MFVCAAGLSAPATASADDGWVYTISNNPSANANTVIAVPYGSNGRLNRRGTRTYRTGGTGARYIPDQSVGVFAGDQQVTLSPDKRWLFAVNQTSGTIAVFRVNQRTGALRRVRVVRSGGRAPISIGFNGRHLVVANHGTLAPFAPGPGADFGNPNLTSFSVSSSGRLRRVASIPTGPGPTQAHIPARGGRTVFNANFYAFGDPAPNEIESFSLSRTGRLAAAPGSPQAFPESVSGNHPPLPPFLPPDIDKLAFGIATHPTQPIVYYLATAANRVAIYRYNASGQMTFIGQEDNTGSFAACWVVLTSDGRYMYTGNTVSQDVSMFRVSRDGTDLTFVEKVPVPSTGTPFNVAVDDDDRFLYVLAGHDDPDGPRPQQVNPDGTVNPQRRPAPANFIEAYRIGRNGRLTSNGTTRLPIPQSFLPYGLAVLEERR